MEYVTLPNSELRVSQVCQGCWQFNNGTQSGDKTHRAQPYEVSKEIVDKAIEVGVNFFDTAEAYLNSEEVVGRVMEGRRKDVIIATKFGQKKDKYMPEDIEQALMQSLQRLRTDYIDLYQCHWPPYVLHNPEACVKELQRLQAKGLIRSYGVCNFGPQNLKTFLEAGGKPVTNQVSYSMLWRATEFEIQPFCQENNIGVLCYSPLQQGLLSGKYRKLDDVPEGRRRSRLFNTTSTELSRHGGGGVETEMFQAIDKVAAVCTKAELPMSVAALSWCVQQPAVSCVIAGAGSPTQVEQNVQLVKLQQDVLSELSAATEPVKTALGPCADMWAPQSRMA